MTVPSNVDPNGQTPPGLMPPGLTPNTPPGLTPSVQPPPQQQKTTMDNLPQDIQDYIKDLRKESEDRRKELEAKVRADQEKEQERLKKQGEWQSLAEQRDLEVRALQPVKDKYEQLSGILSDQIKAQTKDWPKEVKDLLPGNDTPIEVRYAQMQKLQALADKVVDQSQQQQRSQLPGNKPGPQPNQNSEVTRDQQVTEFRIRRKQGGQYSL